MTDRSTASRSLRAVCVAVSAIVLASSLVGWPALSREASAAVASTPVTVGAGGFVALSPARLLDTRVAGQGPCVSGGSVRALKVAGAASVPSSAAAVSLNVTVTGPTTAGYVTVFPFGSDRPTASNLNFSAGQTVPNAVTVKVGPGGQIALFVSGGCANLIVDVAGFFAVGQQVAAGGFTGLSPARLLDTRSPGQGPCVAGGSVRLLTVTGVASVPSSAAAVSLNVTVTGPTASGYSTVFPAGGVRPTASNLNFSAGQTVPNAVTVKVGAGGQIALFVSGGCAHLIVDVAGFFSAGSPVAPGGLVATQPVRLVDTRSTSCVDGGTSRRVTVADGVTVPTDASAVLLNVTVTRPTAGGYVTVSPTGADRPTASNLNFSAGQTVPNMVTSAVGVAGQVDVYVNAGCADVIVDLVAYQTAAGLGVTKGVPVQVPALPQGGMHDLIYTADAGEVADLAATSTGSCPDTTVSDPGGTTIATLTGCGATRVSFTQAGPHRLRVRAPSVIAGGTAAVRVVGMTAAGVVSLPSSSAVPALDVGGRVRFGFAVSGPKSVALAVTGPAGVEIELWGAGTLIATGSQAARTSIVAGPLDGNYTVDVINRTGGSVAGAVAYLHVSEVGAAGILNVGTVTSVPSIPPGGAARWSTGAAGASIAVTSSDPSRCMLLRANTATGSAERSACGATHLDAPTGTTSLDVVNLASTQAATGLSIEVRAPASGGQLAVGASANSPALTRGQAAQFPLVVAAASTVNISTTRPAGDCRQLDVLDNAGATLISNSGCGPAALSVERPLAAGSYNVRLSDRSDTGSTGAVTVAARSVAEVPAGALSPGTTQAAPAIPAGQRAVWTFAPAANTPATTPLTAALTGQPNGACVAVAAATDDGTVRPLGDACTGNNLVTDLVHGGPVRIIATSTSNSSIPSNAVTVTLGLTAQNLTAEPVTPNPLPAVSAPPCREVLIMGARGSGQSGDGETDIAADGFDAGTGFGREMYAARNFIAARLERTATLDIVALGATGSRYPYKAAAVPTSVKGVAEFVASIAVGTASATAELLDRAGSCGDERIVLLGYSQGAMVMHRAITTLQSLGRTDILNRIDGVLLLADGDRKSLDFQRSWGTAPPVLPGIAQVFQVGTPLNLPADFLSRAHSVCNRGDIVCNPDINKVLTSWIVGFDSGARVHTTYSASTDLQRPSDTIADAVLPRLPAPPRGAQQRASDRISFGRDSDNACVVRAATSVWCWGQNDFGQLGDGTTTSRYQARQVVGLGGATKVAVSGGHACVLLRGGTAKCWGSNFSGQLGNGTQQDSPTPVTVSGLSGAVDIEVDSDYSCALLLTGRIKCWGNLRDTTTGSARIYMIPEAVPGEGFKSLLHEADGCAIGNDGRLYCRDLGPMSEPQVQEAFGDRVVDADVGWSNTCALTSDGTIRCNGSNAYGQLGQATRDDSSHPLPVEVKGVAGGQSVSVGDGVSGASSICAAVRTGSAQCWGDSTGGRIGTTTAPEQFAPPSFGGGKIKYFSSPVTASGVTGAIAVKLGQYTACALRSDDSVWCWGEGLANNVPFRFLGV